MQLNIKNFYRTNSSGVYILKMKPNADFDLFDEEKYINYIQGKVIKDVLYVGMTDKKTGLYGRIHDNHLRNNAANSTLRRTIGWFMDFELNSQKRYAPEDEIEITNWLLENTYFQIIETENGEQAERIEDELILEFDPPFNIEGRANHINRTIR